MFDRALKILLYGLLIASSSFIDAYSSVTRPYVKGLYSLPLSLDPIKMNDSASLVVGNLIYDGLVKFSPTLSIEPAIAESWSTSSDGKILTFKIRENAKFQNGWPIQANDVVVSLTRALSKESRVRKYYDCIQGYNEGEQNAPLGIEVINNKTVRIKLKHPFPPFLSILAGATAKILPARGLFKVDFFIKPIGSGAFVLKKFDKLKKEIILNANNEYYSEVPRISSMILKETTEIEAIKLAQDNKIDDLANWPLTATNPIFEKGKNISSPVAATWIIGLNSTTPPFNDLKVRQAFKSAVDTEAFRMKYYPDAIKAKNYIPFGLTGSQIEIPAYKTNKPSKDKITLVIPKELADAESMKLFFEVSLRSKGWNFEVKLLDWDKLMDGYNKKSHQAFLVSMNMDYPDPEFLLKNFESNNSDNFSGIKDKNLDAILKTSRSKQDRKIREQLYIQAIKKVEELALTVNLFHPRANYWINKCVDGFTPNILSDVYIDYSKVSILSGCIEKVAVK